LQSIRYTILYHEYINQLIVFTIESLLLDAQYNAIHVLDPCEAHSLKHGD